MKNVKEKYVELCLKLDAADKVTNTRKFNQAMTSLNKLIKYLDENKEDATFLIELLVHENYSVRGYAAAHCYNQGMNTKQALAVMKEVYKNAPPSNLGANIGIKLGIIDGSLSHLIPKQ